MQPSVVVHVADVVISRTAWIFEHSTFYRAVDVNKNTTCSKVCGAFAYLRSVKTPSYQGLKFLSDLLQLKETAILSDSEPDLTTLQVDSPDQSSGTSRTYAGRQLTNFTVS